MEALNLLYLRGATKKLHCLDGTFTYTLPNDNINNNGNLLYYNTKKSNFNDTNILQRLAWKK